MPLCPCLAKQVRPPSPNGLVGEMSFKSYGNVAGGTATILKLPLSEVESCKAKECAASLSGKKSWERYVAVTSMLP